MLVIISQSHINIRFCVSFFDVFLWEFHLTQGGNPQPASAADTIIFSPNPAAFRRGGETVKAVKAPGSTSGATSHR